MLNGASTNQSSNSLMSEYASLLGNAVLRHRTRIAEHSARTESEHADKIKSEFVSNMSHELRTPLNAVIGFSKILSEHRDRNLNGENIAEYASLIHDAATHLLTIINDILDISKMQSGNYTLDEQEVDLLAVLSASAHATRPLSDSKNISVEFRAPAELPNISGEANKIAQIFDSIISNAIKFTHPGGTVTIAAECQPDHSVAVAIRDTGVGMNAEELSLALKPFGQVDGSRSRWQEGTGLGLSIAKVLTELHGGQLHIRSTKDVGTEVSVVLPLRDQVSVAKGPGAAILKDMTSDLDRSVQHREL